MSSYEGKVIIITGCSNGIGLASTLLLLSRKCRVFGIDVVSFTHELDAGQESNFAFHQVDLKKQNAAEESVKACLEKFGPKIDGLANIAGVVDAFCSADTIKESEWEHVLTINLNVPVRMMAAVLPNMKEHKSGAIVNMCSYASNSGAVAGIAYTTSKHGLAGATKNVAWRFHNEGIRCNGILPGGIATNIVSSMLKENMDQDAYALCEYVNFLIALAHANVRRPIHKVGASRSEGMMPIACTVDDVARAVAFLITDDSKGINGAMLPVDNAWSTT